MARSRSIEAALAGALLLVGAGPLAGRVQAAGSTPPALSFSRHGKPVATRTLDALRALAPARTVRVLEPYEGREVAFTALPFDRVLDAVYTPSWRHEQELLFTCRDGYQPTLPVARVLAHRAWLAFGRAGQAAFTIRKRESGETRTIDLAPFYLVWDNRDDAQVRRAGDYGWPYQLVGVDLIRTRDRFPRMTPPRHAPEPVRAGFAAFRVQCSRCHPVNGEGGTIGPELVGPGSPLERRDRDWLRRWILDPARILPTARMPALDPQLKDRARTADEILAYLEAMQHARSR